MSLRDELAKAIYFADNHRAPEGDNEKDWGVLVDLDEGRTYAHVIADGLIESMRHHGVLVLDREITADLLADAIGLEADKQFGTVSTVSGRVLDVNAQLDIDEVVSQVARWSEFEGLG